MLLTSVRATTPLLVTAVQEEKTIQIRCRGGICLLALSGNNPKEQINVVGSLCCGASARQNIK